MTVMDPQILKFNEKRKNIVCTTAKPGLALNINQLNRRRRSVIDPEKHNEKQ